MTHHIISTPMSIVVGKTGVGKTTFIRGLLENLDFPYTKYIDNNVYPIPISNHSSFFKEFFNAYYPKINLSSRTSVSQDRLISMMKNIIGESASKPTTIVIENPELGLHPSYVAIFGEFLKDTMIAAPNIKFVIETQSDTLISKFSHLIRDNKTLSHEVRIFIVKDHEHAEISTYNEDGCLENWEFGFFSNY